MKGSVIVGPVAKECVCIYLIYNVNQNFNHPYRLISGPVSQQKLERSYDRGLMNFVVTAISHSHIISSSHYHHVLHSLPMLCYDHDHNFCSLQNSHSYRASGEKLVPRTNLSKSSSSYFPHIPREPEIPHFDRRIAHRWLRMFLQPAYFTNILSGLVA